ncbi:hypothetical protein AB0N73_05205 [Microbacterium sp. NPDC089189]|uniref:hypothetical protein n=1 Tax=Microbacterium sp. NPDC089189 TaxID=3154972 RepID=UPI003430B45E
MAQLKRVLLIGGAGLVIYWASRTWLRRAGAAVVVARTVWRDPKVKKLRRKIEKKVARA